MGHAGLMGEKEGTQGEMRTVRFPLAISSRLVSLESVGLFGPCRTSLRGCYIFSLILSLAPKGWQKEAPGTLRDMALGLKFLQGNLQG